MPIAKLSTAEAIEAIKSSRNNRWPERGASNRLAPMAMPHFKPRFALPQEARIVTIGSGFGDKTEQALKDGRVLLPALDGLENDGEFMALGGSILNTFNVASTCNALKWAFEDEIDEQACFYKMGEGWVDLHLQNTLPATDKATLRQRRRALGQAYRSIADCDAVLLTLGQSEVWFDTASGCYLNAAPRRAMMRENPDRFELHVLGYGDTIAALKETVALIAEKGRKGVRVILAVSPVPMVVTYRETDVMAADTYSKSVLRAAAEEIVQTHNFVDYFPSFESVALSERATAYGDDAMHPTQEIIAMNIKSMVQAFTGVAPAPTLEDIRADLGKFRNRPKLGFEVLSANTDCCVDPEVAAVLTECAIAVGRYDVAELALGLSDDPAGLLRGMLYMAQGDPAAALAALRTQPDDTRYRARFFTLQIKASILTGKYKTATRAARTWAGIAPKAPAPYKVLAQALADQGDARAEHWFDKALAVSEGNAGIVLELADFLVKCGKADAARIHLEAVTEATDQQNLRKTRLLRAI